VSPEIHVVRSLRCLTKRGSIDVTDKVRAHRFDRGLGAEQRHRRDHLET
jgi:hypothetical protein